MREVADWVKNMVEKSHPEKEIINNQEYKVILNPKPGDIVYFKPFHNTNEYEVGDFYKIEIVEGQYWGSHGLSNFWYWYRLNNDGSRGNKEHGYGAFYTVDDGYVRGRKLSNNESNALMFQDVSFDEEEFNKVIEKHISQK